MPAGRLFLLGDDHASSVASRSFGSVPADDVVGVVRGRLWPSLGPLAPDRC